MRRLCLRKSKKAAEESDESDEIQNLDDDEDDDFFEDNVDDDQTSNSRKKYSRSSYMPKKDTCLYRLMQQHEAKWKNPFSKKESLWSDKRPDPVTMNSKDPEHWYASRFEVFNWIPFDSFGTLVNIEEIKCVHCGQKKGIRKHGTFCWRSMFRLEGITWIFHQRLRCLDCKKSFTTIDPSFLEQIPTRVLERFPFFTSKKGIGIHQSIVFQFVSLADKGIMYGTFVKTLNEVHRIQYDMNVISFYDSIAEAMENEVIDVENISWNMGKKLKTKNGGSFTFRKCI